MPQVSLASIEERLDLIPRRKPSRASEGLINAMIQAESAGDPSAVSPAGAQGLMQLMPATAKDLGVDDPFDPIQNVRGGTRYINDMLTRYGDDYELALMAYNWGPRNVDKWLDRGRSPKAVPKETRDYVKKLLPAARERIQVASAPVLAGQGAQAAPMPPPPRRSPPSPQPPAPGPKWGVRRC